MPVDGLAAARTLLSYDGIRGGYCLFYVWQAYKAHGASTGRSAPTATEAWNRSDRRHPGDRNPPPGVPVFWGPKASSNAGDVVISLGGGRVAATDWPRYGVTGICTIDERERQIGRPYLGWAECIFDQLVALPTPAGIAGAPHEEDDVALTNDEKEALALIPGMNKKLDDWAKSIELVGGVNEKVGWVLASMERDGLLEAEQTRVLASLLTAMPAGGSPGAPVDLSPVLAAIGNLDAALAATPAAVRAEFAEKLTTP